MFGCQDISVMIEKRKRKFLQKLSLSNSVVWTVCQEYVSISNIGNMVSLAGLYSIIYTLFRLKGSQHKIKPVTAITHKDKRRTKIEQTTQTT